MKIGLLIIATEILEGKILDINGRFLSDFLKEMELELNSTVTVRDDESEIHNGLKFLMKDCDLIVTSGGLGPTKDDLTKDAIGSFLGRKSDFSLEADLVASKNYERLGRVYPGKDHVYSQMPMGLQALSNQTGFAPGIFCEHMGKHIICAPGVPREFVAILEEHLKPWIKENYLPHLFMENVVIRTRRVPEEKIFGEVDPTLWDRLSTLGDVSSLPILMGVNIGVKIKAPSLAELRQKKSDVLKIIKTSPVMEAVWYFGPEKLEEIIVALAQKKKLSYGFAESCTGGLCSHRITAVPGSSQNFYGSIISYDTSVKEKVLNVPSKIIEQFGVVSLPVAEAMAQGLSDSLSVDIGISTTGIAGPSGGTEENPVGTVCIATHFKGQVKSYRYHFRGSRELLKERFAEAALMLLFDSLEEIA